MEPTNDLIEHLMRLMRLLKRGSGSPTSLSRGNYHMLRIVSEREGIRTTELAERLDIRPSSLTEQLHRAEHHGLVSRERDPKDSRVSTIHATQKARDLLERHRMERDEQSARWTAALTAEETQQFCALCEKLSRFLEAQQPVETGDRRSRAQGRHHRKGGMIDAKRR